MNNNMPNIPNNMYYQMSNNTYNQNSDRLIGGFAFPFLLGGVTGAAIAPSFWNRPPYYGPRPPYPQYGPRPPYGPYYGPYYR